MTIKIIANSVAVSQAFVSYSGLTQYTTSGLNKYYNTISTTVQYLTGHVIFDDLRTKLILHEQCLNHLKNGNNNASSHQAFTT